ncbi:hypothetical protein, partial [Akkermansia sp.]|uniref:hypothetical protein n=1 Tax=Akkermansia sp. TaxID=1872421 RepID=UPI003AEFD6FE
HNFFTDIPFHLYTCYSHSIYISFFSFVQNLNFFSTAANREIRKGYPGKEQQILAQDPPSTTE